ncbi:MAG: phenylalanine--tRNA ligase subunit beta [Planctomycetota bacterium]|jgi:phenylalanyl-tRNA synthetase beta chain
MKISLNWLTDYVDVSMPAGELAELFTRIGLPCDGVTETEADIVFDLEITSNRPDLLGHIGVARELAVATGAEFRMPVVGELPAAGRVEDLTSVEVLAPELCPRYTARVIRGVKVCPSPRWLIERLEAVGLRGINNIVDITNYVLMAYSQPLHSFDYDKLAENRIVVRRARAGEVMVSIDGTKCRLDEQMLIIADAKKPVAIAGVMGGKDTEVVEGTRNVLIESAQFDPLATRRTSRKLGVLSESNYRFERGVDPVGVERASLRACQLILALAGGELAEGVADVWAEPFKPRQVTMRPKRCNALLGMEVPPERQMEILEALGLSPRMEGKHIACSIPSHRGDLKREADLIEEVARLEGYDKIPSCQEVTHTVVAEGRTQSLRRLIGQALAAAGFDEALTYTFIDRAEAELFGYAETVEVDATARKTNNVLRPTLLPSLLRACKANQDVGNADVSLYELASVFPFAGSGELPEERTDLGLVTTRSLRQLRGTLEAVASAAGPEVTLDIRPAPVNGLDAEAAGEVLLGGEPVGAIGLISQEVGRHYGLERTVAAGHVSFDALLAAGSLKRDYHPVPRFPPVRRDLSVIVDESVTWSELRAAIDAVQQPLRISTEYVTTYRGEQAGEGKKSVTVTLVYRSPEGTLRSEQVDEQIAAVTSDLRRRLEAGFRM